MGPGKFNYGTSDLRAEWKRWKRGFNSWLIGSEQDVKKEPVKVNLLLSLLGSDGHDIYETFEWPDATRTLDGALERFDAHFSGLSNVTMTRFRFFSYTQGDLSVTNFVTGLKSLANDCEFGELRDSLIKDMVVIHCSDEKLRERLLKEQRLDLAKAIEIARIAEEAAQNVDTIGRTTDRGSAGALVAGKRAAQGGGRKTPFRRTSNFDGECFECGEYGHPARDCPDREDDRRQRQARNRNCSSTSNDQGGGRKTYAGYAAGYALGAAMNGGDRSRWYVDSGASTHMTWDRASFDWFERYRKPRTVKLGDGTTVRAYGQGDVKLRVGAAGGTALVTITQVQFVPKLQMSLLSIPATTALGNEVTCKRQICIVSCGSLRLQCSVNEHGLYEVPILSEHGGAPQFPRTSGCSTPGGVIMKSEHRGRFSPRPMDNVYDGNTGHQADPRTAEPRTQADPRMEEPRTQARGPFGCQDSTDARTNAGGQGYPGASTRNGSKAGGQGYPGASSRKGSR